MAQAVCLLLLFCALAATLVGELWTGIITGCMAFIVYRFVFVREILCRFQRKGILLTRDGHWSQALEAFEKSERFWRSLAIIDRSRGILLGSSTRWPFSAMARTNQVTCLAQLNRYEEAIVRCEEILVDYPEMGHAKGLLHGLRRASQTEDAADPQAPPGLLGADDQSGA